MTAQSQVDAWNEKHPVGTRVIVWRDNGEALETVTRSEAHLLGTDIPVIWVEGIAGCHSLAKVRPVTKFKAITEVDRTYRALGYVTAWGASPEHVKKRIDRLEELEGCKIDFPGLIEKYDEEQKCYDFCGDIRE